MMDRCECCGEYAPIDTWPFCRACRPIIDAHRLRWADSGVVEVDPAGEQVTA